MALSGEHRANLERCAQAIVQGKNTGKLRLAGDSVDFAGAMPEIISILAREVERRSGGRLTVREANPSLFVANKGVTLYLVRCPRTTPSGKVNALGANMAPMIVTELGLRIENVPMR